MRGGRGACINAPADAAEFSSPPAPPPPCFAWSPSPAIAGADVFPSLRAAAKQSSAQRKPPLDCFVARASRNDGMQSRSRDAPASELVKAQAAKAKNLSSQSHETFASEQEGRRSADRRHPTKLRTIGCGGVPLSLSPPPLAGEVGRGRARLSALHRGTRQAGRNQHWLSSRPALPETRLLRALPVVASLESTEHLGDRS